MMGMISSLEKLGHDKRAAIAATVIMGVMLAAFAFLIANSLGNP